MIKTTRPELKLTKSETETVSSNESKAKGLNQRLKRAVMRVGNLQGYRYKNK